MKSHNLLPPDVADRLAADRELLRALCQRIADRIERDIAILDALCPDADLEPSLCGVMACAPVGADDDRELDDADLEATAAEWTGRSAHRFDRGVAA